MLFRSGWWEPSTCLEFFANKKEWDKLPKEYQAAFACAAAEANVTMTAEYDHKNPIALAKLLQNGVKLHTFSKEIMEAAYKSAQQLYADESAKNPAFKKIYDSYAKYAKSQRAWFTVAEMPMDLFPSHDSFLSSSTSLSMRESSALYLSISYDAWFGSNPWPPNKSSSVACVSPNKPFRSAIF